MEKVNPPHPYEQLTPNTILDAVESVGQCCDGRIQPLNSYENRVYQVGIEDHAPLIAKFYRPQRWSNDAINEEHRFTIDLAEQEIPVVAPIPNAQGQTLSEHAGFRFSLSPRHGGRWPELDAAENLERIGRYLGRIHALGAITTFTHRPTLSVDHFGTRSYHFLLENDFIPFECQNEYMQVVETVLETVSDVILQNSHYKNIRLHGDCHPGNILWTDQGAHIVDFDDCINGPAIQDLWMLLSGNRQQMSLQLSHILRGYKEFHIFSHGELVLIEPLRTLRLLHYSAWLARRWQDPAFPKNFPWFNSANYWQDQINSFKQQDIELKLPPLSVNAYL